MSFAIDAGIVAEAAVAELYTHSSTLPFLDRDHDPNLPWTCKVGDVVTVTSKAGHHTEVQLAHVHGLTHPVTVEEQLLPVDEFRARILTPTVTRLASGFDQKVRDLAQQAEPDSALVFASGALDYPPGRFAAIRGHRGVYLRAVFDYSILHRKTHLHLDLLFGLRALADPSPFRVPPRTPRKALA